MVLGQLSLRYILAPKLCFLLILLGDQIQDTVGKHSTTAGQLDVLKLKNKVGPLPHTIYTNELKMDQRPQYKSCNYKTLEENTDVQCHCFLDMMPKTQATKVDKLKIHHGN